MSSEGVRGNIISFNFLYILLEAANELGAAFATSLLGGVVQKTLCPCKSYSDVLTLIQLCLFANNESLG